MTILSISVTAAELVIAGSARRLVMSFVFKSVTSLMFVVALVWLFEHSAWREARVKIDAQSCQDTQALLSKLLSSFCDAVVSLNPLLQVTQRVPKLGSMLMRHPSLGDPAFFSDPLQFMEIVHEEDR